MSKCRCTIHYLYKTYNCKRDVISVPTLIVSLHFFYRHTEQFLRYAIVIPYFWLWFSKTYSAWNYNTTGRNTKSFRSPVWRSRSLCLINKSLFQVQLLCMFSLQTLLTSYSNGRWKEGATCRTLGQKVKGQPSGDSLVTLIFWQYIVKHLGQCFFLLCAQTRYDEKKMPRKFEDKRSLIKVSKGNCPKALEDCQF